MRYEEALFNYYNTENGTIVSIEVYDISYENEELKEFTLYRYDGSEYILCEQYKIDSSKSSGLSRKYNGE